MSSYSAFKIKNTSGLKIPANFINEYKKETKKDRKRIKKLNKMSDDEMTVTELKELQSLIKKVDAFCFSFSDKIKVVKYPNSIPFIEGVYVLHWHKKRNTLSFDFDEDEFEFILDGDFFVGNKSLYAKTNYDWGKEFIYELLSEFKGSAIIEDMGDEEYGFVDEDGCERDLEKNETWDNGHPIN